MTDLGGKTALVTGASGGLGLHFARTLAAHGAKVILTARREAALADAVAAIGPAASAIAMDVCDPASVEAGFAKAGPIDICVNNAGVTMTKRAMDLTEEDWSHVVETNLTGAWRVARAAAQGMAQGGTLINIASILGLRVSGGVLPYCVSKAGVVQMTRALALEWARLGIRVNALAPGYIETDINRDFFATEAGQALIRRIPQRRLGRMEELDSPLLLLASDASSFMTGTVVEVDGGHMVSGL
ncbi:SDR family oxidoreductase [Rhodobacteraceae bacterium NNCM2]|nr:SDR family oxidoreductase [Coraliihabitans acroporae]